MSLASAFEALVRETRPQLVRYLGRLVGPADADDVTQIALSKAAAAFDGFRGEASPRAWLFRIATNAAHDWMRTRRGPEARALLAGDRGDDAHDEDEGLADTSDDSSQERRLVREEMSQCVAELLDRLPEGYRTILALSDCDELSDREVATVLGITLGSAKIRLHRARTRLKKELERNCSFYHDDHNVLCCDRREPRADSAYRSEPSPRPLVEGRETARLPTDQNEESIMSATVTLSAKESHLIGVGASIAAGCQPCTQTYATLAKDKGACERGVRFALEAGLAGRERATSDMASFAHERFARPELDAAFLEPKALLDALIGVAAAIASSTASQVKAKVALARSRGATETQIRLASEIALKARQGAARETDNALTEALGGTPEAGCGASSASKAPGQDCGCGCK